MLKTFLTIAVSVVITLTTLLGVYNYAPLSFFEGQQKLGSTITTIQGTDTLKDSRSVINTNFTNLNNGKIENSTTSLPLITTLSSLASIGTITTGVWSGTTIGVNKGGTGSTTLSAFHLLMGSSTNAVDIVSGLGTSGQFLTSQGGGLPPQWTTGSIDLSLDRVWTGLNNFTGTTLIKSFNASSSLVINGVTLNFPSTVGASNTVPMVDGSANITWNVLDNQLLASVTATGTVTSLGVDSLPTRRYLTIVFETASSSADSIVNLKFNSDGVSNYSYNIFQDFVSLKNSGADNHIEFSGSTSSPQFIKFEISNVSSLSKQVSWSGNSGVTGASHLINGVGIWRNATANISAIQFAQSSGGFLINSKLSVYGSKD